MTKQGPDYMVADRYRIERRLGVGTTATVFEATDTVTSKGVAIKVLHQLFAKDRIVRKRFLREAEAARALRTPHAVKVMDVGEISCGIPYLVMELLHGSTLERILRRKGRLPIERTLLLTDQMATALQDAHGIGIIHRDLKPENIFVTGVDGTPFVKVVDFGISKLVGDQESTQLTDTGVMVGTPVYMAPEQLEGKKDLDARVDVYSLGVVMFEMLAGESPLASAKDFAGLLRLLLREPPSVRELCPDVPEGLASIITQAMARDRVRRLPTMESLRRGIAPFWRGSQGTPSISDVRLDPPQSPRPQLDSLFDDDEDESDTRPMLESFCLGSLFDEEDLDLATRREASPFRGESDPTEHPEEPSRLSSPAVVPSQVAPVPKAPPPLPLRGPAPRPSRPPPSGVEPIGGRPVNPKAVTKGRSRDP